MKSRFWIKAVTLLLSIWLLTSCSSGQESLWLKSPDWSRGIFIGNTGVVSPVSFVSSTDGSTYFFLTEQNEETSNTLFTLVRIRPDSEELDRFTLPLGEWQNVKQPEIVRDNTGELRLFWISNETLYTLVVSGEGAPVGEPVLLSGSDAVSSYDIAYASDGSITLWYAGSRRSPGIYALSEYDGTTPGVLIDPDGTLLRIRYDAQGRLHTAWAHYPFGYEQSEILYGVYDAASGEFSTPFLRVTSLDTGPSTSLDDFALGADNTNIYILWTTSVHTGPQSGVIQAKYVTFPIDASPQNRTPNPILAPTIYTLEFSDSANDLKAGQRVSLQGLSVPTTDQIQDFRVNPISTGEVVLAFRSPAEHLWRKTREQVNLLYFDNGDITAYQPLTFTSTVSTFPNVVNDRNGYVSLTWLEKQSSNLYAVYFASTSPQLSGKFNTVSFGETLNIVYTVLFGMLIGALLAPIAAAVWMLAPLAVLALFSFIRRILPNRINNFVSLAGLVAGVGVIWFIKLAILPLMMTYVPFSAWIPNIPELVGTILKILVPLLTLALSVFVAWHFTYRHGNNSSLYFILIYVAVDALITTSIYAVLIYGTYVQ